MLAIWIVIRGIHRDGQVTLGFSSYVTNADGSCSAVLCISNRLSDPITLDGKTSDEPACSLYRETTSGTGTALSHTSVSQITNVYEDPVTCRINLPPKKALTFRKPLPVGSGLLISLHWYPPRSRVADAVRRLKLLVRGSVVTSGPAVWVELPPITIHGQIPRTNGESLGH